MNQFTSFYNSARLAAGYAYSRPPVHPHVIRMVAEHLHITKPLRSALDVGCGAGRSTDALGELAEFVVGLEPVPTMLAHIHAVAPRAFFAVGRAEELPFRSRAFDLITAAGSLNYVDLTRFFPEAARVLAPTGRLIIYDFSAGRRFRASDALDEWFASFERRYPFPPDYELDVRVLDYGRSGLRPIACHEFEVALSFTAGSYVQYILSEANVEFAIVHGVPEGEIRDWCSSTIERVFGGSPHDVLFGGYIAYVCREGGEASAE
jgi:SAM-dependent methyltransferase